MRKTEEKDFDVKEAKRQSLQVYFEIISDELQNNSRRALLYRLQQQKFQSSNLAIERSQERFFIVEIIKVFSNYCSVRRLNATRNSITSAALTNLYVLEM